MAVVAFGLAVAAAAIMHWLALRPGIMVWDSIRQYGQAVSGRYDDWHPPAMNWLWHELSRFGAGPAPMLVLQLTLYWGGTGLLGLAALRRGRWWLSVASVAAGLLPIPLVLMGTILKDSLMAGCLLTAAGIIAQRQMLPVWARALVAVLLVAAATLRFNAVPAVIPLALAALPCRFTASRIRVLASAAVIALPLLAAMPIANRLLDAQPSGVEDSLIIYDLGGITYFSKTEAFPPLARVADPVAVNADCYSTISWDRYAWWGDQPCAIGFSAVRDSFASNALNPTRWWLGAIVAHPVAYAAHRAGHFNRNIRLWTRDSSLPSLSLRSDPNDWHFAVGSNPLNQWIEVLALRTSFTPLGWPACWIALGALVLFVWPGVTDQSLARPLLWSGLLYALSFLPMSVASEVRYHLWTMIAIGLGSLHAFDEWVHGASRSRSGLVVAAVVMFLVMALCAAARIAA